MSADKKHCLLLLVVVFRSMQQMVCGLSNVSADSARKLSHVADYRAATLQVI